MLFFRFKLKLDRDKRIWYISPMRAAKVQASLRIRAVSPEPSLLVHTSSESKGTFKVIYKGSFKSFVALCADRICSDQHFVENCIEKFPSV